MTHTPPSDVHEQMAARADRAGLRRIHIFAFRDRDDPDAGGSEEHASQVGAHLVAAGREVVLHTARVRGAPRETERDGIPALIRRRTPLQALAIPSSSVMTNAAGTLCVWLPEDKGYRAVTVTIAGARGGVTNVATGLEASQQVLANPAQVLENPQCP